MRSRVARRAAVLAVSSVLIGSSVAGVAADQPQAAEYALKAAFLYNFALYTDWPDLPEGHFDLCVLGDDPFGEQLDAVGQKRLKGRAIRLRRLQRAEEIEGCQLLFVAASARASLPLIAARHQRDPMLTIADADGIDPSLPMIRLVPEGSRVTFRVNLTAARAAGLELSAKLLQLARSVE